MARYLADLAGTQQNTFRIAPAASAGPPSSGYHRIGEEYVDSLGARWYCVVAGTPGVWVGAAVGGTQAITLAATDYVLQSLPIATYRTVRWALELKKGSTYLIFEIVGSHDGSTASDIRPVSMQLGTGVVDVTAAVAVAASNLELSVRADTTGWTATWQRVYAMPA
jgi:hypothetical protein